MVDGGSWPKSMVLSQSCFDSSPKYMGSSLLASEEWIWKINFKDGSWVLEETIFGGSFLFSSRWFIFRPRSHKLAMIQWSFYIVKPQQTTIILTLSIFYKEMLLNTKSLYVKHLQGPQDPWRANQMDQMYCKNTDFTPHLVNQRRPRLTSRFQHSPRVVIHFTHTQGSK